MRRLGRICNRCVLRAQGFLGIMQINIFGHKSGKLFNKERKKRREEKTALRERRRICRPSACSTTRTREVKTRTIDLKNTNCSFSQLFALFRKDVNYFKVIFDKSLYLYVVIT